MVALRGTLETFALPDVLRLLAATGKTGRVRVSGDRGHGEVWVEGGAVVAAAAERAPLAGGAAGAVFELLRFGHGEFSFEVDQRPEQPGEAVEVEAVLADAQAQLAEWLEVAAVVPSLAAWVALAPQLPGAEVTVDRAQWATVAAIGAGATVERVGEVLGLEELPACQAVRAVVELGLAAIGEAPPQEQREPLGEQAPLGEAAHWAPERAEVGQPPIEAGSDEGVDEGGAAQLADDPPTPVVAQASPSPAGEGEDKRLRLRFLSSVKG